MTPVVIGPRFPSYPQIHRDDTIIVYERIAIVVDLEHRLRAIFIHTSNGTKGEERGVISTYDHDAGTYYIDEPTRERLTVDARACPQCPNCSRFGHRVCENKGVLGPARHFLLRRRKALRLHAMPSPSRLQASSLEAQS